jgi:hypothetical protein
LLHNLIRQLRRVEEDRDAIQAACDEAQAKVDHCGAECFEPVEKRTIEYADGFDLLDMLTSEGGGRGYGWPD